MFLKSFAFLLAAVSVLAEYENCFDEFSLTIFYKEIGCKPVLQEKRICPTHFDCSDYFVRTKSPSCSYQGELYPIGSYLPPGKGNPCITNCKCLEDRSTGHGKFSCASVECGELDLIDENCTRIYSEQSCCPAGIRCKNDGKSPTCLVDGVVYYEDERFNPKEAPCKICNCKAGFKGKFEEPFCTDVVCGSELFFSDRIRKKCVPVYYGKRGCCPIDWICPTPGKDTIIPASRIIPKYIEEKCKFGDLEFEQYDQLKTDHPNIECRCLIPPYLSCTMN